MSKESKNRSKGRRILRELCDKEINYIKYENEVKSILKDCVSYKDFKFASFFYSLYYQYKTAGITDSEWKLINTYFFDKLKDEGDNFNYNKYLKGESIYDVISKTELLKIIGDYNSNKDGLFKEMKYDKNEYPYNGYNIIKINSYKQAKEYSFTNWCICNNKEDYYSYVRKKEENKNLSIFYFCLRYDYEISNAPLTCISILVDSEGKLELSANRENEGDEVYYTEFEIELHLGIDNFSSVFKPFEGEYIEDKNLSLDKADIKKHLREGLDIKTILESTFEKVKYYPNINVYRVSENGKYNMVDVQGNILFEEWYYAISYDDLFYYDYILIEKDERLLQQIVDKSGRFITNEWYNRIRCFKIDNDYLLLVEKKDLTNAMWSDGKLIFDKWYDVVCFEEEIKSLCIKNQYRKYNYIDLNGNLLFKEWYSALTYIKELDLYKVGFNIGEERVFNLINLKGEKYFKKDYYGLYSIENGDKFIIRNKRGKENIIDRNGKLQFKTWYDNIVPKEGGFYLVSNEKSYNIVNNQGEPLSEQWFDSIEKLNDNLLLVKKNNVFNLIDKKGNVVLEEWYEEIKHYFHEPVCIIKKENKSNILDIETKKILLDKFYESVEYINDFNCVIVKNELGYNILNLENKILLDNWYEKITYNEQLKLFFIKGEEGGFIFNLSKKLNI